MATRSRQIKYPGVRPWGNGIQIRAMIDGKEYQGIYPFPPTQANMRAAAELREEMLEDIRRGTFSYAKYFPESKYARAEATIKKQAARQEVPSFSEMAERYFRKKKVESLTQGTLMKYRQTLDAYFMDELGDMPMDEITFDDLIEMLSDMDWNTAKTFNNAMIPLRGVFDYWCEHLAPGKLNPARLIKNRKRQKPKPDPLTVEEMEAVIAYMQKNYPAHIANLFEFAFLTGLRPGELIALQWSDYNEPEKTMTVQRARVMKTDQNHTKTYNARVINLTERAMKVLQRQKQHTRLMNDHIFMTRQHAAYTSANRLRSEFWAPALEALGIRHRRAYQTRHTYATTAIAAGMNLYYLSRQMGHSSVEMLLNVYGDWVNMKDNQAQTDKLDQYLTEKAKEIDEQNAVPGRE